MKPWPPDHSEPQFPTCIIGNDSAHFLEMGGVHGPECLAQCLVHSTQHHYYHYYYLLLFYHHHHLIIDVSYRGKRRGHQLAERF